MSNHIEISCPSGFKFATRRMYGEAYQAMASVVDRGTQLEAAAHGMATCAVEILDSGPYAFGAAQVGSRPTVEFWKRASAIDLMEASIDLRFNSFPRNPALGKELPITFNCQRCGKITDNWLLPDISIYLRAPRVRPMPKNVWEAVRSNSLFEARIDGKTVRWDIQRLQQDIDMREVLKKNAPGRRQFTQVELVAKQLRYVEGLKAQNMLTWWRWASQADSEMLDELLALFYEHDSVFNAETRVTCQNADCHIEQDIILPFGGKAFWSPKRAKAEETTWSEEETTSEEDREEQPSSRTGS